jgi:hypothetical protein
MATPSFKDLRAPRDRQAVLKEPKDFRENLALKVRKASRDHRVFQVQPVPVCKVQSDLKDLRACRALRVTKALQVLVHKALRDSRELLVFKDHKVLKEIQDPRVTRALPVHKVRKDPKALDILLLLPHPSALAQDRRHSP